MTNYSPDPKSFEYFADVLEGKVKLPKPERTHVPKTDQAKIKQTVTENHSPVNSSDSQINILKAKILELQGQIEQLHEDHVSHGMYQALLDRVNSLEVNGLSDPASLIEHRIKQKTEGNQRSESSIFRKSVISRYGCKCQVCEVKQPELLDAAHIIDWAEGGVNRAENALLLCANHHRAFDRGLLKIKTDGSIVVAPPSSAKALGVTVDKIAKLPDPAALKWKLAKLRE